MSLHNWPSPIGIAHRGSRLLWPENTMEAFGRAVEMGYRFIETDLHITSDDVLVCIHDHTVDRTTDGSGLVSDFSFEGLTALDAGYRHRGPDGHSFRGQGITVPSFRELVETFPDVSFVVDLKVDGMARALADLVEALDLSQRIVVGSFSDERLAEFTTATGGKVPTSSGPTLTRSWLLTSRVGRGAGGTASALQVPTQMRGVRVVDKRLIDTAHAKGLHVHVWTVNEVEEMEALLDLGVDGLVTDRPDLLKTVLERRGAWL